MRSELKRKYLAICDHKIWTGVKHFHIKIICGQNALVVWSNAKRRSRQRIWPKKTSKYHAVYKALQTLPPEIQSVSSRFLYSSGATLSTGKYYLLGYNPGGIPSIIEQPFHNEIATWEDNTANAYLDEKWRKGESEGKAPYQLNVQALCDAVGIDVRKVCATNWFFVRSLSAALLKGCSPEMFFPVHNAIMEIVQPKIIFAVGLNTYKIVKKFFQFEQVNSFASGHGSWACLVAQRQHKQKPKKLIGFPHFSRYALRCHSEVLSRVAQECL